MNRRRPFTALPRPLDRTRYRSTPRGSPTRPIASTRWPRGPIRTSIFIERVPPPHGFATLEHAFAPSREALLFRASRLSHLPRSLAPEYQPSERLRSPRVTPFPRSTSASDRYPLSRPSHLPATTISRRSPEDPDVGTAPCGGAVGSRPAGARTQQHSIECAAAAAPVFARSACRHK
jgi:hypothetical protein